MADDVVPSSSDSLGYQPFSVEKAVISNNALDRLPYLVWVRVFFLTKLIHKSKSLWICSTGGLEDM